MGQDHRSPSTHEQSDGPRQLSIQSFERLEGFACGERFFHYFSILTKYLLFRKKYKNQIITLTYYLETLFRHPILAVPRAAARRQHNRCEAWIPPGESVAPW